MYYVDAVLGRDENSGKSPEQSWRTLERVNRGSYQSGDSILLKGGQVFTQTLAINSSGTEGAPITIGSYGTGHATISTGIKEGIILQGLSHIRIHNLRLLGSTKGLNLRETFNDGIAVYGTGVANIPVIGLEFENIEVSGYCNGIFVLASAPGVMRNIKLVSINSHDNKSIGIYMSGYGPTHPMPPVNYYLIDVSMEHCRIHNNHGLGIVDDGGGNNSSGAGVLIYGAKHVTIDQCVAHDNGGNSPAIDTAHGGGWYGFAVYGDHIVLQNNESHHHHATPPHALGDNGGFLFDGTNITVQYNYSHDNDGLAFCSESGDGPEGNIKSGERSCHIVVRYNISENDSRASEQGVIGFWGPFKDLQVYNNTVYASGHGMKTPLIYLQELYTDKNVCHFANVSFRNNLFITDSGAILIKFFDALERRGWDVRFENNAYFDTGRVSQIIWGNGWSGSGKTYNSIKSWSEDTGQERVNGNFSAVVGDPCVSVLGLGGTVYPRTLKSLTAYRLQSGSPLIDHGLDLTMQFDLNSGERDFFGRSVPSGKGFDIGACEYDKMSQ